MMSHPMIESLESRQLLAATGTHDLLYVNVRFSDQGSFAESVATAQKTAATAVNWIKQYSGGTLEFTVATRTVTLSKPTSYYQGAGTTAIANDADAALKAAGVSLSPFEHVSYRYNGPIGTFGGLGQVGGKRTWIRYTSASIVAHELGHNLGLGHANFANPNNSAQPFGASSSEEYGDVFDNMGSGGSKDWSAHAKYALGWLGGARTKTVSGTTAGSNSYTLTSHDDQSAYSTANTYLIKVTVNSSTAYYIEYRHDPDGVLIHRASPTSPKGGSLIDATPATETANDAMLAFGKSITDPRGASADDDIKITVTRNGTKANVTVTVGQVATSTKPATTVTGIGTGTTTILSNTLSSRSGVRYNPFGSTGGSVLDGQGW